MGVTKIHVSATAVATQVKNAVTKSILVETGGFAGPKWFCENAGPNDLVPPSKRRKTKAGQTRGRSDEGRVHNFIPLQRVTIDLDFLENLSEHPDHSGLVSLDSDFSDSPAIDVRFDSFHENSEEIRLCSLADGVTTLMVATDGLHESALTGIRRISDLRPYQLPGRKGLGAVNRWQTATEVRCVLRQSKPPLRKLRCELSLGWISSESAVGREFFNRHNGVGCSDFNVLLDAFPDPTGEQVRGFNWKPQDFYDHVHVPAQDHQDADLYDGALDSVLYPFQKRAVTWLLMREGAFSQDGTVHHMQEWKRPRIESYKEVYDVDGQPCFVSYLEGIVSRERPHEGKALSGGILAEEMGLGKTVELMALVALHRRAENGTGQMVQDVESGTEVRTTKATLIITPPAILDQWKSELVKHAPMLKVLHYEGIAGGKTKKTEAQWIEQLLCHDVILATYQTIGKEIHFAEDPPDRKMRHARRFERKRSPLVQIEWWRICLDEAQMVESGVTSAARVACRLPRVHSWAVSGTPVRKVIEDLHGLLIFLRYQPLASDVKLWRHLVSRQPSLFRLIFGNIALRHTKAQIRDELHLPPQKRIVLTMPFTAVEQQHYTTLFAEMCDAINVAADGSPNVGDWDPDKYHELMRTWLVRLRQTCLHPQVGGRNRKALGRGQGPLRTVSEVLEVMIEQNEQSVRTEERSLISSRLLHAHIIGNNKQDEHRSEKALALYQAAMETSEGLVRDARERLQRAKLAHSTNSDSGIAISDSEDSESDAEATSVVGRARNHLRTIMQLHHACTFFTATACFQIKSNEVLTKPESERFQELEAKETQLYDAAKLLRRELLSDHSRKAETLIKKIRDIIRTKSFVKLPKVKDLVGASGIENRRILEKADDIYDLLREQSALIQEWREKMAEYLTKPLVDEDEGLETTGDEYEDSTKQQDELYVYFDVVKALQADLNSVVTGEATPLIDHEARFQLTQAKTALNPDRQDFVGLVHAPELTVKLLTQRNKLRKRADIGSIRGLIQESRSLEGAMHGHPTMRSDLERSIIQRHITALQAVFNDFSKALNGIQKEIELFRHTQNQRLAFYGQLQESSDDVAPYKEELDEELDVSALNEAMEKEEKQSKSLAQLKTKNRFLLHLRDESSAQSDARICVICQSSFETGVLTVCGHQYCKECIGHWWKEHRSCPVCKKKLGISDFHNVTYKPQEIRAKEEHNGSTTSAGGRESQGGQAQKDGTIYTDVDSKIMDEIKMIELPSSFGTKIDTLGRHLHWIREHDAGAKSIVFSQYREFLDVLGSALQAFKIGYSRFGRSGAVEKFRNEASVDCLLLDAKTDSSGLTLVNATHVFICEPLIQTALELQAIARVHRIGQLRPTTVWQYILSDTVEESIYDISVARRLEHVQEKKRQQGKKSSSSSRAATPGGGELQEKVLEAADSEQLQQAPVSSLTVAGKTGGEVVPHSDLWLCLFGNAQGKHDSGLIGVMREKEPSAVEREVNRHMRAEAAEQRRGMS